MKLFNANRFRKLARVPLALILIFTQAHAQESDPVSNAIRMARETAIASSTEYEIAEALLIAEEHLAMARGALDAAERSTNNSEREALFQAVTYALAGAALGVLAIRLGPMSKKQDAAEVAHSFSYVYSVLALSGASYIEYSRMTPEQVKQARIVVYEAELKLKELKESKEMLEAVRFASEVRRDELISGLAAIQATELKINQIERLLVEAEFATGERQRVLLTQIGLLASSGGFLLYGIQETAFNRISASRIPPNAIAKALTSKKAKVPVALSALLIGLLAVTSTAVESPMNPEVINDLQVQLREAKRELETLKLAQ